MTISRRVLRSPTRANSRCTTAPCRSSIPRVPKRCLISGCTVLPYLDSAVSWAALKLATDICDGGGIVEFGPERCPVELPEMIVDGEPYRKATGTMLVVPYSLSLEAEVHERRLDAAREFARANGLNRITVRHDSDRIGIVTTGKSHADLMSALRLLRVGQDEAAQGRCPSPQAGYVLSARAEGGDRVRQRP